MTCKLNGHLAGVLQSQRCVSEALPSADEVHVVFTSSLNILLTQILLESISHVGCPRLGVMGNLPKLLS